MTERPARSATAPASTATGSRRCASSSRAGALDVLTGDYLAELTMLILGKDTMKDPSLGYARTFVRQLEDCLGLALERGVKIVSNAGGLNPAGLADRIREVAEGARPRPAGRARRGRRPPRRSACFDGRADRQRLPRRLRHRRRAHRRRRRRGHRPGHRRDRSSSGRRSRTTAGRRRRTTSWPAPSSPATSSSAAPRPPAATSPASASWSATAWTRQPLGFPIAEIAADGSSVITKHDGTGGAVTVDTVTAQLVYEIQSTRYLNPDVTTRLDTIQLEQDGPDRVAVTGVRGEAPPERLKVCVNELGGFRNQVEFVLTGLDVEEKAEWVREQLTPGADRRATSPGPGSRCRRRTPTPRRRASALLRCTVMDPQPDPVGRAFTGPAVELALASYPGFTMTTPPQQPTPYGVYRPEYVDRAQVHHTVVHADGRREEIADPTDVLDRRPRRGPAPVAVPRAGRLAQPPDAARHVRARALRRQGRRRQHRALGRQRRRPAQREARVTWLAKLMTPAPGPRAAARGRATSRSTSTCCPTSAASTCVDPRPARRRAWPRRPGSTRRPRGSASGCARGSCTSRRTCCERRSAQLGAEFVRREVAPHLQEWEDAGSIPRELHLAAGEAGAARRRLPRGGRRRAAARCSTRSTCRRRCSRRARRAG